MSFERFLQIVMAIMISILVGYAASAATYSILSLWLRWQFNIPTT